MGKYRVFNNKDLKTSSEHNDTKKGKVILKYANNKSSTKPEGNFKINYLEKNINQFQNYDIYMNMAKTSQLLHNSCNINDNENVPINLVDGLNSIHCVDSDNNELNTSLCNNINKNNYLLQQRKEVNYLFPTSIPLNNDCSNLLINNINIDKICNCG